MKPFPRLAFWIGLTMAILAVTTLLPYQSPGVSNANRIDHLNQRKVVPQSTNKLVKIQDNHTLAPVTALQQNRDRLISTITSVYGTGKNNAFILVSTVIPERLYLYENNSVVLSTYANTGISQAPTPYGIFHIYEKLQKDTMSGKEPNGKHYYDPNVPWVMYFNGGDAIHGFLRQQYGYPQSLGCVELPFIYADKLYHMVPVGTTVIITSHKLFPIIKPFLKGG